MTANGIAVTGTTDASTWAAALAAALHAGSTWTATAARPPPARRARHDHRPEIPAATAATLTPPPPSGSVEDDPNRDGRGSVVLDANGARIGQDGGHVRCLADSIASRQLAACSPAVRWWGRLEVSGLDALPTDGPVLLAGNHDSLVGTPVAIGIASLPRRQICALAKSSMWKPGLGLILDSMGQIPIERGKGDAHAMDRAIEMLRAGACIGVFPEGTRSEGRELRARSEFGRLADAVPEAQIVSCTVTGTVDLPKFPRDRPHMRVHFFKPSGGQRQPGEAPNELSARLLAEIRAQAPRVRAGRKPQLAAEQAPVG